MDKSNFENLEEFYEALKKITPCDLTDEATSIEDAMAFCKEIMTDFLRAGNLSRPRQDLLSMILYKLGACTYELGANKFKDDSLTSINDLLRAKGSIEYPLVAFKQIFTSPDSFEYAWTNISMDGGWTQEWLDTQNENS